MPSEVLIIRSPRFYHSNYSPLVNFQFPLGISSVASHLRGYLPEIKVQIIDCPAEEIGWKTLAEILRAKKPDIVAVGEPHTEYYHESVKALDLVKKISPKTITIAGGIFFSAMAESIISNFQNVDYVIKGEAEITFSELIKTIISGGDVEKVDGVVFRKEGACVKTAPRALIENLDSLPYPCYEMFHMEKYFFSTSLSFSENLSSVVIETARGCSFQCDFCSLWYFWGKINKNNEVTPLYRKKSIQRVMNEVEECYERYDKRFFLIIDPTFNFEEERTDQFCEMLLKKGYSDLKWHAYLRPDLMIRDEKKGILEKMVKSGFSLSFSGGERCVNDKKFKYRGKTDAVAESVSIFQKKYPQVKTAVSFFFGLPEDSFKEILEISIYALKLKPTFLFLVFVCLYPGTTIYNNYIKSGALKYDDFFQSRAASSYRFYKLMYNVRHKSSIAIFDVFWKNNWLFVSFLQNKKVTNLLGDKVLKIIYRNHINFFIASMIFLVSVIPFIVMVGFFAKQWKKPKWYDS